MSIDWNALKKQAWWNRFRLANFAISTLVLAFAIAASAMAYASMPHPLLGALLLTTIGLVIFRSFIMTRMQREIIERHVREKLLRQKEKELRFAGEVQRHFLKRPPEIPGLEIAAACLPASEVSGDYYDFLPVDEDRWLFILADVAGHGVPAALLMSAAMMSTALFLHPRNGFPGARKPSDELLRGLVRQVDGFLTEKFGGSSFVTAALLLYDRRDHEFRYVSLGHPPALLCFHGDPGVIALDGGDCSGYFPWMTSRYFPPEAVEGKLSALEPWVCRTRPGETLVLYSDGVIEARDGRREEYGLGRLKEALQGTQGLSAQGMVQACLQDLGRFAGPAPHGDDVTMVVVRAV